MSEVLNAESVRPPDNDAKVNSYAGKAGDGRENNTTPMARSAERRGRGEGFDNRSRQSLSRSDIIPRDNRNSAYSGRDGYRQKDKPPYRRSTSRGGTGTIQSNSNAPGNINGPSGSANSPNPALKGRRADDAVERRSNTSSSRSGRRVEDLQIRPRPQIINQGPPSGTGYEKKGDSKDVSKGYIEDPLTKLVKRITRTGSERDRRVTSARQLREYLHGPEIRTSKSAKQIFEAIDGLQNVLFERISKELKHKVAVCIGLLGSCLSGQDIHGFFEWAFSNVNAADDDVKVFLSMALLEMLKQEEAPHKARDHIENVMANVHQMLEAAVTPSLLMVVLDIITVIARVFPHIFGSCFREVTDIVIGWLIDPTQTMHLIEHMSASLVQLQAFWQADIQFSVMLLGQFTEDLELMLEQDLNQAVNETTLETVTAKITALLRVFYTVVLSLGDSISTLRGGQITVEYLVELLNKLVASLGPAVKMAHMENITILSNDSIRLILHQLSAEMAISCGELILPYIIYQTSGPRTSSNSVAVSTLRLLHKIVEVFSTQLPVYVLQQLLGPESLLPLYRFSHCPQVVTELMALYHSLLALKSVPLLEEAYRLVLSDMEVCYNILLVGSNQSQLQLVAGDNPFKTIHYSSRQAQQAIMFNVGALIEIANTKSNLIGMWALSPSIFTLLSQNLQVTDPWMNKHQSPVVYSVLHAFYSHCNRHANFMSSSVLLVAPQIDASRLATMSQANNQNFSEILRIIVTLLDSDSTSFDSRCLLMKWTSDIIASLAATPHIYTSSALSSLVSTVILQGYHREQQIFQCTAQCLKSIFKKTSFPEVIVKKCMELCVYRLSDVRKPVRECFLSLLKILPVDKILHMDLFEGEEEWMSSEKRNREVGLAAAWQVRRSHMASPASGNFHSHNFRHVMAFILSGTPPSQNGSFHWLEAMYHTRQRNGKLKSQQDLTFNLTEAISNNESLQWFWATWECAQFAIVSRLRTPLGKAPETFMAIEGVIKAFATESQSFSSLDDALERRDCVRGEKVGEYVCLQRVHLLMNFMEHLDKLLYNAYEGCAVAMPAVHKVVKTFFRTNRNTCQEWLSRIRMSLLTIAVHCGMWATAVRSGF
ncbi:unnamed protein product [Candidula unifasciata]|uniref:Serine/threonine-protein kinase SMG1 N-terminal domain-containing protein n=1 Tax=Candidula unifasciata TaxID=100452 RepID=A0A8S3YLA7_9EUPU|nr:unnamed protein product [Candidula unifasciata]